MIMKMPALNRSALCRWSDFSGSVTNLL